MNTEVKIVINYYQKQASSNRVSHDIFLDAVCASKGATIHASLSM
jgi:hypothetical protein